MSSSRISSQPNDGTGISSSSCIAGGFFTAESQGEATSVLYLLLKGFQFLSILIHCYSKKYASDFYVLWGKVDI